MINIEVNGKTIEAKTGETLLTALRRAGIHVPTLCHMENLFPSGACRMCVVEIEGQRGLIPSCAYPVAEGMKVKTHSPRAVMARKTIIELLLANHPDDCLYCVRNNSCELQSLASDHGVRQRRYSSARTVSKMDMSSPALVRDPDKCILCGKCVRVCEEIQGVSAIDFINRGSKTTVGTAFNQGLNVSSCVYCGQCIMVCPTGALHERTDIPEVAAALDDPDRIAVIQHAPAVSVTIGEAFGLKPGADVIGLLTAALRQLGFKYVFDTSFSADLTVMEEAAELAHRVKTGGVLPMFTSCSPAWVKFVEEFYPELLPNLSSCKSPQQMLGALIKHYWAPKSGIDPQKIFSVSVMPCTAKKFEATRSEFAVGGVPDLDAVLTTRELVQFIRQRGLNLKNMEPEVCDLPFGQRSSAGKLFGASGGVMEAALRTAHFMLTGQELDNLKVQAVRGAQGIKEASVRIGETEVGVAVVSGLANARKILDEIKDGRKDLLFVEIMSCPGGCINGGGQLIGTDMDAVRSRMQALYNIDRDDALRVAHKNQWITKLYEEYLGEPLGEKSHHLLHTRYAKRDVVH